MQFNGKDPNGLNLNSVNNGKSTDKIATILSASEDKLVKIWDRRSGKKES
jgi:hypothetical protein